MQEKFEKFAQIMKFLGIPFDGEYYENNYNVMWLFPPLEYSRRVEELMFNCSWEWIIPVIDKIEKIVRKAELENWFDEYEQFIDIEGVLFMKTESKEKVFEEVVQMIGFLNELEKTGSNQ